MIRKRYKKNKKIGFTQNNNKMNGFYFFFPSETKQRFYFSQNKDFTVHYSTVVMARIIWYTLY